MSLNLRFILSYGVGGLLILFTLTFWVSTQSEEVLERQLQQQFLRDTHERIEGLERQFRGITSRFEATASLPSFSSMRFNQLTMNRAGYKSDIRELEIYFYNWIRKERDLSEVSFIDAHGKELIHIDSSGIRSDLGNRSQDEAYQSHIQSAALTLSDHWVDGKMHGLVWWVPVALSSGRRQGVLRFQVPYQQVLSRFEQLLFAGEEHACLESGNKGGSSTLSLLACDAQHDDTGLWETAKSVEVAGERWDVHIAVDPTEYLRELNTVKDRVFKVIFPVVALMTLFLITLFSFRFTHVIQQLVEYARQLGGEERVHALNLDRKDELADLAQEMERSAELIEQNRHQLVTFNETLEQQVEERTIELTKAQQAKDEFLASMSHELRTPLTSIIGNTEFLIDGGVCGGRGCFQTEATEVLHSIKSAGQNQLALVNDILDMSKIQSGKFTIEDSPYNLAVLLSDIEKMLVVGAKDAGVALIVEQRNRESRQLLGDAPRIAQILINLIGNALKFTEKGHVKLTTEVENEVLTFKVEDSGIGMPKAVLDRLFKRFEQADGSISRRFGGSGLGLYISINLAEMMGGTIEVSSQEGRGSTFVLRIPYRVSDIFIPEPQEGESAAHPSLLDEKLAGDILIAEDTPELQMLERRILEAMGLTVTVVGDGEQAVDEVNRQPFDLVLMDMQMPVMDGIEATRTLREQGHTLPIVALTANVMQKHRHAFNEVGCDGFLGKPIDKLELRKVLKMHISQRTAKTVKAPASAVEEVDDELMGIFIESTTQRKLTLEQALSAKHWPQVRDVAHATKGSAVSFGYPELSKRAESVQRAIDENRLDEVQELAAVLLAELERVLP